MKTASPVASGASIKLLMARALSQADVGAEYLEIDQPRDNVFIEMAKDVPDSMLVEAGYTPGVRIFRVTKCLYGL